MLLQRDQHVVNNQNVDTIIAGVPDESGSPTKNVKVNSNK